MIKLQYEPIYTYFCCHDGRFRIRVARSSFRAMCLCGRFCNARGIGHLHGLRFDRKNDLRVNGSVNKGKNVAMKLLIEDIQH